MAAVDVEIGPGSGVQGLGCVIPGGEARPGKGTYSERIVRYGEHSTDALREKVRYVVAEMEARLTALGFGWQDALSTQAYTVHDIGPLMAAEFVRRGITPGGLSWHFCRPPVEGLDYEMDVRGAAQEIVI